MNWMTLLKKIILASAILLLGTIFLPAYGNGDSLSGPAALASLAKTWVKGNKDQNNKSNKDQSDNKKSSQTLKLTAVQPTTSQDTQTDKDQDQTQARDTPSYKSVFPKSTPIEDEAFANVASQAMPMTPKQISILKKMLSETQYASAASAETPPKPTVSTQIVKLSPGSTPPVVRLQQGFVTSVVFVDASGADWPIESYNLGNPKSFNLQWSSGSNTIMLQAISMYTYGNLAVKLQGLSTPVVVTLMPGQQSVDYRVDMRIQKMGPNSKPDIIGDQFPAGADKTLLSILEGVPPQGATTLKMKGSDGQAWKVKDKMYLRTSFTVLSPSWIAMMTSPDGTKAYEMKKSAVVLISKYGKPAELKLEGL